MEWRHSGSPRPKKIRVQKYAGKALASIFFGIKRALIIFQRVKLSTRSITHLCWCNWRTFWRENAARGSQRGSCSCTTMPGSPGTCNPEETGLPGLPITWSPNPILRIWPRRTTACSLDWKNNWKIAIIRPTRKVIAAAETWLDGQTSKFFWVACKS